MKINHFISPLIVLMTFVSPSWADESPFHKGPVFKDFGKIATIESDIPITKQTKLMLSFDVSKPSNIGQLNRTFNSAARFINMNVEAGVPKTNIQVAIVIHGKATFDVSNNSLYASKNDGAENYSIDAISKLIDEGVEFYVCGQSAAYYGVKKTDLLPGVKMALSAMNAHTQLQQKGYSLNPF